jgi:hypothetical protein
MFAGIDVASETHMLARLDGHGRPIGKPTPFTEDQEGYAKLDTSINPAASADEGGMRLPGRQ